MKNKYLASLGFALLTLLNTGCEEVDKDAIYQEEFHKILYLKTTGIVDMTLYDTGADETYNLSVIKGGSETGLTADVKLVSMTKAELDEYCEPRGLHFVGLPESCYALEKTDVQFAATDQYKLVGLEMHTSAIRAAMESSEGGDCVIPLILTSAADSVNANKNIIIIKPTVVTPSVSFEKMGYVANYCGKEGKTFEIPLMLQINNQWDFTCQVEVDFSALAGTSYNPLPQGSYELENNGLVTFTKGNNTALLKVKVNGLTEADNVLPLRLKSISNETFDIDERPMLLGVTINKYPLTKEMLSTNAQEPSEGPLANILDGDVTTYFHSAWSVSIAGKHYVQVALPSSLSSLKFSYTNRSANGNAALGNFDVSISNDGSNFVLLKNFTSSADKLPQGGAGVYNSSLLKSNTPFTHVRFTCNENMSGSAYFVWSEFSLYGL